MNWAVVIGIDRYDSDAVGPLSGAVRDAERFRDWARDREGGNVPEKQLRLLVSRAEEQKEDVIPTKDSVIETIHEIVSKSRGSAERLYFYFSGHGVMAKLDDRSESALLLYGFSKDHHEHSFAVRSLLEFLETEEFKDQFFFLDACRDEEVDTAIKIGRWPVPRKRDPGKPPVQQFVLYATSPGLTAAEEGWPEEEYGIFSDVLWQGLGDGDAKTWSWSNNAYEVRWDGLADFVRRGMEEKRQPTHPDGPIPPGGWPIQIPQDVGIRGVAERERDPVLTTIPREQIGSYELAVTLVPDRHYDSAVIRVLDAVGSEVARVSKLVGNTEVFKLPPKTYAVLASADDEVGDLDAPIELYDNAKAEIQLRSLTPAETALAEQDQPVRAAGEIVVDTPDRLAIVEARDEAGRSVLISGVDAEGMARLRLGAGFYRVRLVGPEKPGTEDAFVALPAGREVQVRLSRPPDDESAAALASAAGMNVPFWGTRSTVLAVALGESLQADGTGALAKLNLPTPSEALEAGDTGIAFYVAGERGTDAHLDVWISAAGELLDSDHHRRLELSADAVAGAILATASGPHWLAIERGNGVTVVTLPVFAGRLATVIAELDDEGARLYQLHPATHPGASSSPDRLRAVELVERLVLSGRIDGAHALAGIVAGHAAEDPFAGCLAGYVLLRIGDFSPPLGRIANEILAVSPRFSDAYVLRGEYEGYLGNEAARDQAFADAVNSGIPAFGEGLTRLIEGTRVSGLVHPRSTVVRHIFQKHVRGTMWSAFNPARTPTAGRLVIESADLGMAG
jgi:Caspase domain